MDELIEMLTDIIEAQGEQIQQLQEILSDIGCVIAEGEDED